MSAKFRPSMTQDCEASNGHQLAKGDFIVSHGRRARQKADNMWFGWVGWRFEAVWNIWALGTGNTASPFRFAVVSPSLNKVDAITAGISISPITPCGE